MTTQTHNYIVNFIINAIIGSVLIFLFEYVFLLFAPTSQFFMYYSVELSKTEYSINEELTLKSTSEFFKAGDMKWNDVLRCYDGSGNAQFYSEYTSSAYMQEREKKTTEWVWHGIKPTSGRSCYIDSTSTMTVKYGIKKTQNVVTGPFYFVK